MEIEIISDDYDVKVPIHFPEAKPGINCRSNIILKYKNGFLNIMISSDEFEEDAIRFCSDVDMKQYETTINVIDRKSTRLNSSH